MWHFRPITTWCTQQSLIMATCLLQLLRALCVIGIVRSVYASLLCARWAIVSPLISSISSLILDQQSRLRRRFVTPYAYASGALVSSGSSHERTEYCCQGYHGGQELSNSRVRFDASGCLFHTAAVSRRASIFRLKEQEEEKEEQKELCIGTF